LREELPLHVNCTLKGWLSRVAQCWANMVSFKRIRAKVLL
jgi:hypothetical protein